MPVMKKSKDTNLQAFQLPVMVSDVSDLRFTFRLWAWREPVLHAGNQFQITLREVRGAAREQIEAAAIALKEGGFINYYGLQRFGSGSVPTHK